MSLVEKSFRELLADLTDPRRDIILRIYDDHADLFETAAGSGHNHQAWTGGYADHLADCLRTNDVTYDALQKIRPLDFSKDSAAICLFFHDMEKPFRYGPAADPRCAVWQEKFRAAGVEGWEHAKWDILADMQGAYGFAFSEAEINALTYTHGEGSANRKDRRVAGPLAAHVHHCDNTSARIWPEKGQGLGVPQPRPPALG